MRLAASRTRARVRASTRPFPFSACETVVSETPATAATSRTVGRSRAGMAPQRTSPRGAAKTCCRTPHSLAPRHGLDFAKTCWLRSLALRIAPEEERGMWLTRYEVRACVAAVALVAAGCG